MHDDGGCALAECDCHEAVAVAGAVALVGAIDQRDDDDRPFAGRVGAAIEVARDGWRVAFIYGPTVEGAILSFTSPDSWQVASVNLPREAFDLEPLADALVALRDALRKRT